MKDGQTRKTSVVVHGHRRGLSMHRVVEVGKATRVTVGQGFLSVRDEQISRDKIALLEKHLRKYLNDDCLKDDIARIKGNPWFRDISERMLLVYLLRHAHAHLRLVRGALADLRGDR